MTRDEWIAAVNAELAKITSSTGAINTSVDAVKGLLQSIPEPPPPDGTFTIIAGPTAVEITASGAKITWSLSEVGTGVVEYGRDTSYGQRTPAETSFNYSSHGQKITGLSGGTQYHYRVRSTNQAGVEVISSDATFSTASAPAQGPKRIFY